METCRIAEPYAPKDHQRNLGTDQNRVGSWINLREIARKMGIAEGTVLAHAKRHGWTQQIQAATREVTVMQLDAITAVQSVPQSLAAIMADRKQRTKLGLSKDAAEAADQAKTETSCGSPEKGKTLPEFIRRSGLTKRETSPYSILAF